MIVKVKYSAWSNISYKGVWEFEIDVAEEDWAELAEEQRDKLVNEMVSEKLAEDISWSVVE